MVLIENCNSNENQFYGTPIIFLGYGSPENRISELQFSFGDAFLNKKHKLGRSSMRTISLRSLLYVMEHLLFLVVFLRRTENWFSLKIARKLRFSKRTDLQFSLRTDFIEQLSASPKMSGLSSYPLLRLGTGVPK